MKIFPYQFVSDHAEKTCLKWSNLNYWCFLNTLDVVWTYLLIWDLKFKVEY